MKIIAMVIGGMLTMSGCGFLGVVKGIDEEQKVSIDGVEGIRIELKAENVHLMPTAERGSAKLHLHGRATLELKIASRIDGAALVVSVDHLSGIRFYQDVVLDISLPPERVESLAVAVSSHSGNMELDSLALASYAHSSNSGRMNADELTARHVSIRTSSGNITAGNCTGTIAAISRSGNVRVAYRSFENQTATIETGSGSDTLELPEGTQFALEARTHGGRILSDFPVAGPGSSDGREIVGQVGSKTNRVSIETSSGAVMIRKR